MSLYDASALWLMLRDNDQRMRGLLMADMDPAMMAHTPAEFLHVLRCASFRQLRPMTKETATAILSEFNRLGLRTIALDADLSQRAFALRDNLSGYDALYMAAAERDGLRLVGRDKGHRAVAAQLGVIYVPVG